MTYGFAVDASYSVATAGRIGYLKDQGVELFIQCLWTGAEQPSPRVTNLRMARDMGLPIAGYISLNARSLGAWHMNNGRTGVPDDLWRALAFVAVDVELPDIKAEQVLSAVDWVHDHGKRAIIYTSWNAWVNLTVPSNSSLLKHVPLWNAYWDGDPDVDFPSLRYGGWRDEDVWIEQWSGGVDMEMFVDRNTFVKEKLLMPQPPDEESYLTVAEATAAGMYLNAASRALLRQKLTAEEKAALIWLLTAR